jgi:energy-converting hydrogenase Eha subunit G
MSEKNIMNVIYHSAVISGLSVGYSMITKRLLKMKVADLDKLNLEDSVKLVAVFSASIATKDFLVKQGIIPENISK